MSTFIKRFLCHFSGPREELIDRLKGYMMQVSLASVPLPSSVSSFKLNCHEVMLIVSVC